MKEFSCYNCERCGMDMDMDPFCVDKTVLAAVTKETGREYPYGLKVNAARQACKGNQFTPRIWINLENDNI